MKLYNHKELDAKWQKKWEEDKIYRTKALPKEKKVYVLDMFPYPSGEGLHVGHPKGYIATDIYSRFKRMNGYDVLHPMGWDAFGLPAEQFALKNKIHPKVAVEKNIANFKGQLAHIGLDYDWSREINTTDPSFYKWTQWIFTKLYEKGLAYESNEPINWCPSCKTGLANEDVNHDGTCERCDTKVEKKPLRQWVLKITKYADRLLTDLDSLNWPEGVKLAQKNWIGRSEGAEFDFKLTDVKDHVDGSMSVKVFTTRADTIFGATFLAVSAEMAKTWLDAGWETTKEVKTCISDIRKEQEQENDYTAVKQKKGVYTGINAINPATNEKIPVWVANYVIGGVGTGAIMAVPAHDERDYDFAKKYSLPIKQVVQPIFVDKVNPPKDDKEDTVRHGVIILIKHWSEEKYLIDYSPKFNWKCLFTGGIDDGEDPLDAAVREMREETGYQNVDTVRYISFEHVDKFHAPHKGVNRIAYQKNIFIQLKDGEQKERSKEEQDLHHISWLSEEDMRKTITLPNHLFIFETELMGGRPLVDDGSVCNSGMYNTLSSANAREKIIEDLHGKKVVKYKIEDWVFARQRYWGEPFPVVRDKSGNVYMVDESDLPVLLPDVESYEPTGTGESPLATIEEWINVKGYITDKGTFKQSSDGKPFTRETNTMPQWAGSSWYYLRFIDPHNDKALIDPSLEKAWQPVDVYVGGDHATRHLIYARFWHKFLYDIGVVSTSEPFSRLEFLGFILAEDGRKMSKRWGNIINPDDVVHEFGADTLRVYEMFMAAFDQTAAWSTSSIKGSDKFLDRVYALQNKIGQKSSVTHELHKTIKKVTDDIEAFKFNTAISQMMILLNEMEASEFTKDDYVTLLKILAPFAPHLTEEVWSSLGSKGSIHTAQWPTYDEKFLTTSEVTLAIQVNGKLRGTIVLERNLTEGKVIESVKKTDVYQKYLENKEPNKIIVVPNRIVNIVI